MNSVIIAVVVVLGIIVAGGFLLYFMGDLLMGLSGKRKKDSDAVRDKQIRDQKALEERVNALENKEEAKNDPRIATILYNGGIVEEYDPNEDEEATEETPAQEEIQENMEEETEEVTEEAVEEKIDDTSEYIKERRRQLLERLARMQEERDEEEAVDISEDEEDEEETPEENEEESVEEADDSEEEAETTEDSDSEDEEPASAEEMTAISEEIDAVMPQGKSALAANFTLEELEAKLAAEQEKLKNNEKDLRKCKKEFIPLRKVKRTLESDENKLRRKEALVAKQKVVLYGVNNYADIDEEKARKLAEDLDLLDGLKLSVEHCQEVMDKNQDRYPLLEKLYEVLSSQNEGLKNSIKELQDAINELKGENND